MESARFRGQNRLFGAKPCPGPGAEFSNLVTSLVVLNKGGKVVLPLMTSSLVLLKLSFIKFSSAQALMFSTSSEALSLTLGPTGMLHVMSSAYSVIKVFWEVGLISLIMMVKSTGPRTVPWGTPRLTGKNGVLTLSTHTLCWQSFKKSITQLTI